MALTAKRWRKHSKTVFNVNKSYHTLLIKFTFFFERSVNFLLNIFAVRTNSTFQFACEAVSKIYFPIQHALKQLSTNYTVEKAYQRQ